MTNTKNNLPQFEEQQFINQDQQIEQIQEILNKFPQPIPTHFLKLELEEGNCCGPTNPKWKNKPLSERYFSLIRKRNTKLIFPILF